MSDDNDEGRSSPSQDDEPIVGDTAETTLQSPEIAAEALRSCQVEREEEEDSHIFDSFRRLFIMESAATTSAAPSVEAAAEAATTSASQGGSFFPSGDAVGVVFQLFPEPMDESAPMVINAHLPGVAAVNSLVKDGKRKSPKRTLAAILDEESAEHPSVADDSNKPSGDSASLAGNSHEPSQLTTSPSAQALPPTKDIEAPDPISTAGPTPASSPLRRISSSSSLPALSTMTEPASRESPKRPSEDQPEGSRVSPKRLSLQFRPDRISSTSTPFGQKIPAKGVRALSFDQPPSAGPASALSISQPPSRRTRLSSALSGGGGTDYSLDSIPESPSSSRGAGAGSTATNDVFISPADQSSIIAHGFPSSFFYSPCPLEARSTSGAVSSTSLTGGKSKDRCSLPGPATASPSTVRFRQALRVEITRRLSLDQTAAGAAGGLPFASPSKHPMLTRSSSSSSSTTSCTKEPDINSSKWPVNKPSLYSLYEALSQVCIKSGVLHYTRIVAHTHTRPRTQSSIHVFGPDLHIEAFVKNALILTMNRSRLIQKIISEVVRYSS